MNSIRVIPLGTSSGVPTRERNVSAVAIALDSRWILMDCGEGTQYRLLTAPLKPRQLEAVFITHLHGDHIYGLPGLISTMSMQSRTEPLVIHGPEGIRELLECVIRVSDLHLSYPLEVREIDARAMREPFYRGAGFQVLTRPLDHRGAAQGYALIEDARPGHLDIERIRASGLLQQLEGPQFGQLKAGKDVLLSNGSLIRSRDVLEEPRPGRRVAYCTDTRPCAGSVELGEKADLLIHEATYLDELAAQAGERGHSTAAQAARVARDADAERLLITHFSPRYGDPSALLAEAREIFPETNAARDLEIVEIGS